MRVIIVGAHAEAKQLINRISAGWEISVIDMDQDKLRNFTTNRQIEKYQGDGTSTLVLKKAGIENANAVITLTESDEVNIEVLKIAKQNKILRLSSVINDESFTNNYKELAIELVDPGSIPYSAVIHPVFFSFNHFGMSSSILAVHTTFVMP